MVCRQHYNYLLRTALTLQFVADTLDRCEVPFFGPLASRFLDDE